MSKYSELVVRAMEIVNEKDVFVQLCEELDCWNGFLDGVKLYDMEYELDELHCGMKLSEFLNRVDFSNFNFSDEFWYYNGYGNLCSTNESKFSHYSNYVDADELYDEILDKYSHLDIKWIDEELDELLQSIIDFEDEEEQ